MVARLVAIALILVALIGIFGNLSSQGNMDTSFENLQTSVTMFAYAGEFDDIKSIVDEFLVLRTIRGTDEGRELAEKLDEKINNLELVKMYCSQKISTHDLAMLSNPYQKVQELCPKLEDVSFSKAANLFRLI